MTEGMRQHRAMVLEARVNRTRVLSRRNQRQEVERAVIVSRPDPARWVRGAYSYDVLFNAIAIATKRQSAGVSISVKAFEEAMIASTKKD